MSNRFVREFIERHDIKIPVCPRLILPGNGENQEKVSLFLRKGNKRLILFASRHNPKNHPAEIKLSISEVIPTNIDSTKISLSEYKPTKDIGGPDDFENQLNTLIDEEFYSFVGSLELNVAIWDMFIFSHNKYMSRFANFPDFFKTLDERIPIHIRYGMINCFISGLSEDPFWRDSIRYINQQYMVFYRDDIASYVNEMLKYNKLKEPKS